MNNYVLSCCSTSDITKEHLVRRDINYICFHYSLNGKQYLDDMGESLPFEDFYQEMAKGAVTKTSQVNIDEFINYFEPFLKEGKDILHVCLSSGISGVYNSAKTAKEYLKETYPNRTIYIVDSLGASSGYGLIMNELSELRDKGASLNECYDWVNDNKLNLHHWFFSTDLTYYIRGGRISKVSGYIGTILNICPLLNMDDKGRLIPRFKIRGKKRVVKEIVNKMIEHAQDGLDYNGKCYISNSACYEDALAVASLVKETFPNISGEVIINSVGTTIGSHTGPGTVALFFWGDKRES